FPARCRRRPRGRGRGSGTGSWRRRAVPPAFPLRDDSNVSFGYSCARSARQRRRAVVAVTDLGNRGLDVGDQEEAAEDGDTEDEGSHQGADSHPEAAEAEAGEGDTDQDDPDTDLEEHLVRRED